MVLRIPGEKLLPWLILGPSYVYLFAVTPRTQTLAFGHMINTGGYSERDQRKGWLTRGYHQNMAHREERTGGQAQCVGMARDLGRRARIARVG